MPLSDALKIRPLLEEVLLLIPFVILLLSRFIFGILGSTDTSTHIGFVGVFLHWKCAEGIPLCLELESGGGRMEEAGHLSPLIPLRLEGSDGLPGHGGCNLG